MRVGMIGLGKLGLPVSVAMALRGADVMGFDINHDRMNSDPKPELERGPSGSGHYNSWLREIVKTGRLSFGQISEVVTFADVIFVAVQTPHDERYEGIRPLPFDRKDFDYTHLRCAVESVAVQAEMQAKDVILVVISTCLPGTMRREVIPLLNDHVQLIYNPYFIAMGTTMEDFLNPEAVLLGHEDVDAVEIVEGFYKSIGVGPTRCMGIESAELSKVAYNTWISAKLSIVNVLADICQKTEADIDEVTDFLRRATDRIVSPRYMTAGMGDGGGCHPRDNIALSWLAQKLKVHFDLFDAIMTEREQHARWLAEMMIKEAKQKALPMAILGYAYKPETNLTIGSHALLVREFLRIEGEDCVMLDEHVIPESLDLTQAVYLIGCLHPEYHDMSFPIGSVIIDPWRAIPDQNGCEVIRIGEGPLSGPVR